MKDNLPKKLRGGRCSLTVGGGEKKKKRSEELQGVPKEIFGEETKKKRRYKKERGVSTKKTLKKKTKAKQKNGKISQKWAPKKKLSKVKGKKRKETKRGVQTGADLENPKREVRKFHLEGKTV